MSPVPRTNRLNSGRARTYRGTILAFSGSWQSGIAVLSIGRPENGRNEACRVIPCENGPTARALIAAFACAGPGHSIDNQKLRGRKIEYSLDDLGMLAGFTPIEGSTGSHDRRSHAGKVP